MSAHHNAIHVVTMLFFLSICFATKVVLALTPSISDLTIPRRSILAMQQASLSSVFTAWAWHTQSQKQNVMKGKKFLAKLMRGLEARCFERWTKITAKRRADRKLIKRVLNHLIMKEVQIALTTWKGWVEEVRRNQFIMRKVGMKMAQGTYSRCFSSLVAFTKNAREKRNAEARQQRLLKKAYMKMMRLSYARSFASWVAFAQRQVRERNLLAKFASRMKNKTLFVCLRNWQLNAKAQRDLKVFCYKALCRIASGNLSAAWNGWTILVMAKRAEEQHGQLQGGGNGKGEDENERRERLVRVALGKILFRCLASAMEAWVHFVDKRRRARFLMGKVMRRITGGLLGPGFCTWADFVKRMNWQKSVLNKVRQYWSPPRYSDVHIVRIVLHRARFLCAQGQHQRCGR